jgi:hypothetical protein
MKAQAHELRQRAKDYTDLNTQFNALQVKVDLLQGAKQ